MERTRLLHYDLHDRLGHGGMGVVYRATDTRLGRQVALKFLSEGLEHKPEAVARLEHEAQAAARLDHPNIGTIHAIETLPDGRTFIVMALYEGETLEALLQRSGRLPPGRALEIAIALARGLAHAHAGGVVHRDMKPANVLLPGEGPVKILDFGLALAGEKFGESGGVVGTPEFMSPQQVRGEQVDARADLWALGVILYLMLTGDSPFASSEGPFATIYNIATRTPPPLAEVLPQAPPELDAVLERALAKDPVERYRSAEELLQDLRAVLAGLGAPRNSMDSLGGYLDALGGLGGAAEARIPDTLPPASGPLLGRDDELKLANIYLADAGSRVVTLVGPGGVGKTALALQAARTQLEARRFLHGVFHAPLDTVASPAALPAALASAVGLALEGGEPPAEALARHIANRQMLLLLDNFEHLTEAAEQVSALLARCANLKLMVTSRERLSIPEEWVIALPGLRLPEAPPAPEEAERFGALALFARHARRVQPGFRLDRDTLPPVMEICRLVGGLPLGIELAAAWARTLSPARIASEIRGSYEFLARAGRAAGGSGGRSKRHLSMRAVFERSWELLGDEERGAMQRLAVFEGAFDPAAAREVLAAPSVPLPLLAALTDKSLLQNPAAERFELHPLLRQFSREKLAADRALLAEVRERHARHGGAKLASWGRVVRSGRQRAVLGAIERDLPDLRAAWLWLAARAGGAPEHRGGDADAAAERAARHAALVAAGAEPLRVFFDQMGRAAEGRALFARARAALAPKTGMGAGAGAAASGEPEATRRARGRLMVHEAWLTVRAGDADAARELLAGGVALLRPLKDLPGLYWAANALGATAAMGGDFARAGARFADALRLAEHAADDALRSIALDNLGSVAQAQGDADGARKRYAEALALARKQANTPQVVAVLNNLGALHLAQREPERAKPLLEEGRALAGRAGVTRLAPYFAANLGQVNFELGDFTAAAKHYREALQLAREGHHAWLACGLAADLARVATAAGRFDAARAQLRAAFRQAGELDDPPLLLHAGACLAELWHAEGAGAGPDAEWVRALALAIRRHPGARWDDKTLAAALLGGPPTEHDGDPAAALAVVRRAAARL